jgi:F-type H+-transporting ATPase subunit b
MEEIIHAFGIDWRLIVIQMFNFVLLMAALWYFLYTPVLAMLRAREEKLKQGVLDAEKAEEARKSADTEKGAILKEARTEAETIVESAKSLGEEKRMLIIKEAEAKAERVLQDAHERAEEKRNEARKASEAEIAQAAILAAEALMKKH